MTRIKALAALAFAVAGIAMADFAAAADCHVGVVGAAAYGTSRHTSSSGFDITPSFDVKGGAAGGELGCKWQSRRSAWGFEADVMHANVSGKTLENAPNPDFSAETRLSGVGTLRGVLGY